MCDLYVHMHCLSVCFTPHTVSECWMTLVLFTVTVLFLALLHLFLLERSLEAFQVVLLPIGHGNIEPRTIPLSILQRRGKFYLALVTDNRFYCIYVEKLFYRGWLKNGGKNRQGVTFGDILVLYFWILSKGSIQMPAHVFWLSNPWNKSVISKTTAV